MTGEFKLEAPFRRAEPKDCLRIAELFNIAGAGVPEYVWTNLADEYPGLSPLEIGEQRYLREDIAFSFRNTVVAEIDGKVVGILIAFPIESEDEPSQSELAETEPESDTPDVMRPFHELEIPGSYYICGVALSPEHRGRGLGTGFMEIARNTARNEGLKTLSLIAFEQNPRAVKLYEKLGFDIVDSRPLVPHPLIQYTGKALLMAAKV
ncbi:MAG: GNAT family N-acetyltransferase [Rhodospirillales bacterium]|jgi:ribosomal protein S18 acetylase RimI-like enzyme|nr:GNAT family N-acetyltransferase [Rhodospirillales bacterium]